MADFVMVANDLLPELESTLTDESGTAINLSGATVKLIMRQRGASEAKINAAATIVSASTGEVKYTWSGSDTDTEGGYIAQWEITFANGKKQSVPNDGYMTIEFIEDLG